MVFKGFPFFFLLLNKQSCRPKYIEVIKNLLVEAAVVNMTIIYF